MFYVKPNAIKLGAVSNPMIKSFILPEMQSSSPKDLVSLASSDAFDPIRNPFERNGRITKSMYMVRHDDESSKRILMQFMIASIERRDHAFGNSCIVQPKRPCACPIQSPISLDKVSTC